MKQYNTNNTNNECVLVSDRRHDPVGHVVPDSKLLVQRILIFFIFSVGTIFVIMA